MRLNLMALIALFVMALATCDVCAQRRSRRAQWQPVTQMQQPIYVSSSTTKELQKSSNDVSGDAIDEVNALRAKRGLPPFQKDPLLCKAALACAQARASALNAGHTANDFAYLPSGAHAASAGCAAWPQEMGFGACCVYDNYSVAGAAWVIGRDGLRYCHLYVR